MTRTPFIAGNWKMNGTVDFTRALCSELVAKSSSWPKLGGQPIDVAVFPSYTALAAAAEVLAGSAISLGAQNMHEAESGAYTGEISADMLLTIGCSKVILGHSERRHLFGETDAGINRKTKASLSAGLQPIVCVGELLEEREAGQTEAVIERQLAGGLADISQEDLARITLAYEPVWAIGTGKVATVEQAGSVHRFIRQWIAGAYSPEAAERIRIQYGGSVKPDNAAGLLADPDIDGALVGGASLKADQFDAIICAAAG